MRTNSHLPCSYFRSILIFTLILIMSQAIYSQSFLSGFGIEIGGGYNQLLWQVPLSLSSSNDTRFNRTHFDLTPEVRIKYAIQVRTNIYCSPFLGYNRFGGQSNKGTDGYQDEIWFDAFDLGFIASYQVSRLSFGVGYKANRHNNITGWYHSPSNPDDNFNWTSEFRTWSHNVGIRISYELWYFSIAGESWFGISELQGSGYLAPTTIRQNHFRLFLGYTI